MFYNIGKQILFLTRRSASSLMFYLPNSCIWLEAHSPRMFHTACIMHFITMAEFGSDLLFAIFTCNHA